MPCKRNGNVQRVHQVSVMHDIEAVAVASRAEYFIIYFSVHPHIYAFIFLFLLQGDDCL